VVYCVRNISLNISTYLYETLLQKKEAVSTDNLGNSKIETNKSNYGLQTFSLKMSIRFATDQSQTGSRLKEHHFTNLFPLRSYRVSLYCYFINDYEIIFFTTFAIQSY